MKYPLIIVDWDGTVMDSVARIVASMQASARILELPVPSVAAVKDIIGISLQPAIEKLFGRFTTEQMVRFTDVYRQQYVVDCQTPSPLFAGALATLQQLREQGYQLAVATGKARQGLERAWDETATRQLFDFSRCADEAKSKPDPTMLVDILTAAKRQPHEAVMIGDSIHDMRMAAAVNMPRIGVGFGVHDAAQLQPYQPLAIISQWPDLLAHV
ncbi:MULTISPECIES: HAD family hydrolase [Idiomarinaceae]|uniref:HAD family hydrolase n=1 Tax=Pseudidiomarina sp. PP-1MA TaxID=3237706 RepID=A0AB39X5Q9_9GAMM|nr:MULTISPECIES: HAD-IA family hydrolase [Idiomarina]MDX1525145.1 HAD-IA family hydrolase [Pseudidiomarina maritima]MRJ40927.1 HAD-IA family hydrolase [Idiomarina sp. FeN1]NCU56731.1 HAD-IA family hydrolase [Idiomarina sp. FenA--70]NCU59111.1 HAD-IA family hydrolase [Idiomarina sp. FenBw--71]UUN14398.1 HAD-IA family hydrolase [Idiomarina loihiensis]